MNQLTTDELRKEDLLSLATDIISAYLSKNDISKDEIPDLIMTVYTSLATLQSDGQNTEITNQKPAVSIRRSITPEHIICLEDGKKLKMLKRYLRTNYKMTPEDYRAKWNLPHDYPVVAPNYAKQRSEFAKTIGLGKATKK